MTLIKNQKGNYHFLQGIAPYSCGVIASAGYEIIRIRLHHPLPLEIENFNKIINYISDNGRPKQALCSMELRVPEPLSFDGFSAFNDGYRNLLRRQDLLLGQVNPLARTNIAPLGYQVQEPSIFAFSFTTMADGQAKSPTFVVAGAGDLVDQTDLRPASIVRPSEIGLDANREKVSTVMEVMENRLHGLGVGWSEVSTTNMYTAIPLQPILEDYILKPMQLAALGGVTWYYSNPPIQGLAFEMDVRGLRREMTLEL